MLVKFRKKIAQKLNNAFTLIEVMVAMLVLSIGLLGLAGITILVIRSTTLSQQISEATNLGADLMETLKAGGTPTIDCSQDIGVPAAPTNCSVVTQSGLLAIDDAATVWEYLPPLDVADINCALPNVLATNDGTPRAYELITSNLVAEAIPAASTSFCSYFEVKDNLPNRDQYIRYYRIVAPATPTSPTERRITVGVLWRHQGKWRKIHLTTLMN